MGTILTNQTANPVNVNKSSAEYQCTNKNVVAVQLHVRKKCADLKNQVLLFKKKHKGYRAKMWKYFLQ